MQERRGALINTLGDLCHDQIKHLLNQDDDDEEHARRKKRASAIEWCSKVMIRYPILLLSQAAQLETEGIIAHVFHLWLMNESKCVDTSQTWGWWRRMSPELLASACILTNDRLHLARALLTHSMHIARALYSIDVPRKMQLDTVHWDNAIDILLLSGLCKWSDLYASFPSVPDGVQNLGEQMLRVIENRADDSIGELQLGRWALHEITRDDDAYFELIGELSLLTDKCQELSEKDRNASKWRYYRLRMDDLFKCWDPPILLGDQVARFGTFSEWKEQNHISMLRSVSVSNDRPNVDSDNKRLPVPREAEYIDNPSGFTDAPEWKSHRDNMTFASLDGRKQWVEALQAYRDARGIRA
jgi:hypothetical protein